MDLTFETVDLPLVTSDGKETVLKVIGEIVAPGLAITPMISADEDGAVFYDGGFHVIHLASGKHLDNGQQVSCHGCITRYAKELAALGIDWTGPHERIAGVLIANEQVAEALAAAATALFGCDGAECPLSQDMASAEERMADEAVALAAD